MAEKWNDIHQVAEVLELIPGTPYARKIQCKLCKDIVFEIAATAGQKEIDAEMVRWTAHMAIQHQITVGHEACSDPNCVD